MSDNFKKGDNRKESFLNDFFGESDSLKAIRKNIENRFEKNISIQSYEAQILQFLIRTHGVKNILEIGTFGGYSTAAMAEDINDGKVISLEKDEETAIFATENLKQANLSEKVEIKIGDAHASISNLCNEETKFDLIFIDAEKKGYLKYLNAIQPLLKSGSIIVADNIFLQGAVYDEAKINKKNEKIVKVLNDFLKEISTNEKYNTTIIPTEEGMSVSIVF